MEQQGWFHRPEAPVPFRKKALDESGAENVAAPDAVRPPSPSWLRSFLRRLDERECLFGFGCVLLRFGSLWLLRSKCDLSFGERVGLVFKGNTNVIG
jgi:hypothetical protein